MPKSSGNEQVPDVTHLVCFDEDVKKQVYAAITPLARKHKTFIHLVKEGERFCHSLLHYLQNITRSYHNLDLMDGDKVKARIEHHEWIDGLVHLYPPTGINQQTAITNTVLRLDLLLLVGG